MSKNISLFDRIYTFEALKSYLYKFVNNNQRLKITSTLIQKMEKI